MRHLFSSLLLTVAVSAQTPACFSLNDASNTASTAITAAALSGEVSQAWLVTPTNGLFVQAVQIYTRTVLTSGTRFMRLELWSDSGAVPGVRLGGGTLRLVPGKPVDWIGCNLDAPVVVPANTNVWVVWVEPGGSQLPTEPGGLSASRMTRFFNGAWTSAAASALKVRLFCNQLDAANSVPFGPGCPLSTGATPTVFTNELPTVGNSAFFFESSGNPAGGMVFALFGFLPNWPSVPVAGMPPGCFQNTDVVATSFWFAGTGTTRGPAADGYLSLPMAIPGDPGMIGVTVGVQVASYDSGSTAPLPFVSSNAHRVTIY